MSGFIAKLREKPRVVRQYYAFGFAASVTLLLVGLWVSTLPARLSFLEPAAPLRATEVEVANAVVVPPVVLPEEPGRFQVWFSQVATLMAAWREDDPPVTEPEPVVPEQPWNELREASRVPLSASSTPVLISTTSAGLPPLAPATATGTATGSASVVQ